VDRFKQVLLNYRSQKNTPGTHKDQLQYFQLLDDLLSMEQQRDGSDYEEWITMLDSMQNKPIKERIKCLEHIKTQIHPAKKGLFNFFRKRK
jgi:hypothetical protein